MSEVISSPENKHITIQHPDERLTGRGERSVEADKRLDALTGAIDELRAYYGFVEGATVFGSTMHGKAGEKSDIDACVFIDPDILAEKYGVEATPDDLHAVAEVIDTDLHSRIGLDREESSSGHKETSDIQVYALNEAIAIDHLAQYRKQFEKRRQYQQAKEAFRDVYIDTHVSSGDDIDWDALEQAATVELGVEPDFPEVGIEISALFHPVASGAERLENIRASLVDDLDESEACREFWWSAVVSTEMFEGDVHEKGSLLPQDVAAAKKAYSSTESAQS